MWQLFQFPLCPFSRKVRLVLAEKGVGHELVRENPWEKRDEFMDLNPAGETPVMVEPDQAVTLIGSQPIVEYFDETVDRMPMIHGNAALRAEIRRMTEWFDLKLFREVVEPLMNERMRKRLVRLDHDRRFSGRIQVDELVALLPRIFAHQLMADALLRQDQADLARKGAQRKLEELPHGRAALAYGRGPSSASDNSDRAYLRLPASVTSERPSNRA